MDNKKVIDKIIEQQSLNIFKVGCDNKNFQILQDLLENKHMKMSVIKKKYSLSSMPANRRINMLANVGLLERINKKTDIVPTKLSKKFIMLIKEIQKALSKETDLILKNYET